MLWKFACTDQTSGRRFPGYSIHLPPHHPHPNTWLADCARSSALFKDCRVEVIPNCIETDIYTPVSKSAAKTALGIDPDTIVLMFGADSSNEKRKGFAELEAAVAQARANPAFEELVHNKRILILALGPLTADMSKLGLEVKALGHLHDDTLIAQAYSASDIYILPSLEDNLPNMMLESMACGTPVLAFSTGGVPDVVQDGFNGMLVPTGDVHALAEKLVELVADKELRERLGAAAATYVHANFTPKIQADRYTALFEELLASPEYAAAGINHANSAPVTDTADMKCGPAFDAIRHKVLLEALLKGIPEICHAYAQSNVQPDQTEQITRLHHELSRFERDMEILKKSLSWRLTAPLRWLGGLLRR